MKTMQLAAAQRQRGEMQWQHLSDADVFLDAQDGRCFTSGAQIEVKARDWLTRAVQCIEALR